MSREGYVYILSNPAMPDIYKIGRTRDIDTRISQLSKSTSIPCDFNLVAFAVFDDCVQKEKEFHKWMEEYSYGKEYFKFDYEDLITYACYILLEAEELGCKDSWTTPHYTYFLNLFKEEKWHA